MGILEQVTNMKEQGISEDEIINNLKAQGISPKAIKDALNQSKIKNAVSSEERNGMNPSIMGNPPTPPQQTGTYYPKAQEMDEDVYAPQVSSEEPEQEYYYPQQEEQPQYYYPQEQQGAYSQEYANYPQEEGEYYTTNTDAIIEVSEQVFSEKIKKVQKQIDEMTEFKTISQTKIDNISERLKKIESTIDKLQIAILEKIGSYGQNLESIKKEMSMMQDSFGKMVPKIAELHTLKKEIPEEKISKKRKSSKSEY